MEKQHIKEFLTAIANDDYVSADKIFPNVINSKINSIINNRKQAVVEQLNSQAETSALKGVELDKDKKTASEE